MADFTTKAAASFPHSCCCLSQQKIWAPSFSGCPRGPSTPRTLGATSLAVLLLSSNLSGPLDELEAFGLVMGQAGLEEHRVHPELGIQQGHVAIHLDKEVDAFVPLVEVGVVM